MRNAGIKGSLLAILIGLFFGLLIMFIFNPLQAIPGLITMVGGWLFHPDFLRRVGDLFYLSGPLIMTGLSVGFAFKTGLFNIGASGQYTMGMFAAIYIGVFGDFFGGFQWIAAMLGALFFGGVWGLLPGILKAFFNVHEVIASIMLNYIAMFTVNMWIQTNSSLFNVQFAKTVPIDGNGYLPTTFLRELFSRSAIDIGILIAIGFSILMYFVLFKTTFGYELKSVGSNRFASKYVGIKENKAIILSMVIAGMLSGIGGALYYLSRGAINSGNQYPVADEILTAGFDGIAVALLAQSHPIATIFSAVFISFIQRGGFFMQTLGIKIEIIDIIIAAIIYASAMAMLLKNQLTSWVEKVKRKKL